MPSLRSCSVGPPPSAIHGRGRLTRHPCRVAHCAEPPLGLSMGQEDQKPKRGGLPAGLIVRLYTLPVGAGLPAMAPPQPTLRHLTHRHRRQAGLLQRLSTSERDWLACRPPSLASQLLQFDLRVSARDWLAGRPSSLASQLLQKSKKKKAKAAYTHALHHSSGRALARLQLLILIHPPPREAEWRCSSGDGRAAPFDAVELIACRCQRSQPEGVCQK